MDREPTVWHRLAIFESHDLVCRRYGELHKRSLSVEKADEITACLAQGRQYFEAAATAGELARPLLLYYGVLAMSRGLILFRSHPKRLASLDPHHGIEARGWWPVLRSKRTANAGVHPPKVLQLPLALKGRGTFAELATATSNRFVSAVMRPELEPPLTTFTASGTSSISAIEPLGSGQSVSVGITLEDVAARIFELRERFQDVLDISSAWYPGYAVCGFQRYASPPHYESHFLFSFGRGGALTEDRIRSLFQLPTDVNIRTSDRLMSSDVHPALLRGLGPGVGIDGADFVIRHQSPYDYEGIPPPSRQAPDGGVYLVPALRNGMLLSSLSLLHLASYALGMLVRYFPTVWQAFLGRRIGDGAFPLLSELTAVVEQRYPELVLEEFRRGATQA